MKNLVFSLTLVLVFAATSRAQPPQGYYDSVDQSTTATFRLTLHNVLDDHTKIPYSSSATDTWDVLEAADQDPDNSSNVLELYRNTSIPKQGGGEFVLQPRALLAQVLRVPERRFRELSLHGLPPLVSVRLGL